MICTTRQCGPALLIVGPTVLLFRYVELTVRLERVLNDFAGLAAAL